jgi:Leucine-rich repeat (LRR) protein
MATFNIEDYLNSLPEDVEAINISNKNLTYIPSLERFFQLKVLDCSINQITHLDNLPNTLKELYCIYNKITQFDNLPNSLEILYCNNNQITQLDNLPNKLKELYCNNNQITQLNNIPNTLKELNCSYNQITQLDNIPNTLKELNCSYNQITQLDNLPHTLKELYCSSNPIPSFELDYWKGMSKLRKIYFTSKYGSRLERYYIKNVRNKRINKDYIDILYSPDFKFYKRLLDPTIQKLFY